MALSVLAKNSLSRVVKRIGSQLTIADLQKVALKSVDLSGYGFRYVSTNYLQQPNIYQKISSCYLISSTNKNVKFIAIALASLTVLIPYGIIGHHLARYAKAAIASSALLPDEECSDDIQEDR